jgi:putative acetyltransferase
MQDILIRSEAEKDMSAVREINRTAFGQDDEADLVDRLRESAEPYLSLVACRDEQVIGHILFTPVTVEAANPETRLMGLAPMSVAPAHQAMGIGSDLVREGIERCRQMGVAAIFVLGHPTYYPRFGFDFAHDHGLLYLSETYAPAFFVLELVPETLEGLSGKVRFHPVFDGVD